MPDTAVNSAITSSNGSRAKLQNQSLHSQARAHIQFFADLGLRHAYPHHCNSEWLWELSHLPFPPVPKLRRPLKHSTVGKRWQRAVDEIPPRANAGAKGLLMIVHLQNVDHARQAMRPLLQYRRRPISNVRSTCL